MIGFICAVLDDPSDQEFMISLVQEHERLIQGVAKKYTSNSADCEDLVQDSLVKMIEKIELLRQVECCVLPAYIVSIIRNTAINQLKRKEVLRKCMDELALQQAVEQFDSTDLVQLLHNGARVSMIWSDLTTEERTLLEGKYMIGYSDEELAVMLRCKTGSIRMKLTRARRRAFQCLIEREGDQID